MALDFPNSPTTGQLYPSPPIAGVGQWRWDGTEWVPNSFAGSVGTGVYMQDAAPTSVAPGSLWFQTSTGILYLYFNDGNSTQWVAVSNTPQPSPVAYVLGGRFQYTNATTCTLIPYKGDAIRIQGLIYSIPTGGVTLSVTGLAGNTFYWVYAYVSGGAIALEASTTGRVTDTTPGNVGTEIKSGDPSRTLVGIVQTNATPAFFNLAQARGVRSWMNRRIEGLNSAQLGTNTAIGSSYGVFTGPINFVAFGGETWSQQCNLTAFNAVVSVILTSTCWLDGSPVGQTAVINMDGTSRVLPAGNPMSSAPLGASDGYHTAYGAMNINTGSATAYSASCCAGTLSEA
jgi:hypothetical protein